MINLITKMTFGLVRSVIAVLIPKSDKLWVFGAYSGLKYSDNSKYLFDYVSRLPNHKTVWLTKNEKIISKLRASGENCYHFFSVRGLWYALRARYAVLCCAFDDVGPFVYINPKYLKIVQLFHGTPLKKLDSTLTTSFMVSLFRKIIDIYVARKYDYVFSTSEESALALNKYFRISKDSFYITGYPRNDRMFLPKENEFLHSLKARFNFKKVVLYLPTWREYTTKHNPNFNLFSDYGFNMDSLTQMLEEQDAIFLIKLHFRDVERASDVLSGLKNNNRILLITDNDIEDPYVLLSEVDVLVTDYSSVFFDYLLLNKPMIFTPFDLKEYTLFDRGFYFPYEENTPGPKVFSWPDLCISLKERLQNPAMDREARLRVGKKFNEYMDGGSCRRIVDILENASLYAAKNV